MLRTIGFSLISLTVLTTVVSCSKRLPLDEIISKHIHARGGLENLAAKSSWRMESHILNSASVTTKISIIMKRPQFFYMRSEMGSLQSITAFDGHTAWGKSGDAESTPLSEPESKALVSELDFDGPLVNWRAKGSKVTYMGKEAINGEPSHHLKVLRINGLTSDIFISANSFLEIKNILRAYRDGKDLVSSEEFSDYRLIDGVMVPFRRMFTDSSGSITIICDRFSFDRTIDQSVFAFVKAPRNSATPS